jgi:inosine/xanthosine triphosphate pyrophosphatase family protein
MDYADICSLVDDKDRSAIARCGYGYYDGHTFEYFDGHMHGRISQSPSGDSGFGWDRFFIPDGYSITRAEMNEADDRATYTQIKPFAKVREFLLSL